jgi:hypothetical protein
MLDQLVRMLRSFRAFLFVAFAFGFASHAYAQTTAFFYDSQPGDLLGGGVRRTITPDDATFTPQTSGGVTFRIIGPGPGISFVDSVSFSSLGAAPGLGTYGGARRFPQAAVNGIDIAINSTGCNSYVGRFVVLEAGYTQSGNVSQFAADFEIHCSGAAPALFGAIRYNSSVADVRPFGGQYPGYSLTITTPQHGTVSAGGLPCAPNAPPCALVFSGSTLVPLAATPDDGYMFTGWTGDCHGPARVDLLVSGLRACTAAFDPIVPASPRTLLLWNSAAGDFIGGGKSDVYSSGNSAWSVSSGGGGSSVSVIVSTVNDTDAITWYLTFRAPAGQLLQPGRVYTGALAVAPSTTGPAMSISGTPSACSGENGQFGVRELALALDGSVTRLTIDFEHHCDLLPPLMGTVQYNSTTSAPRLALSKTALAFGAVAGAGRIPVTSTPPQILRLVADPSVTWDASPDRSWLSVSPASGAGSATLTVSIRSDVALPPDGLTSAELTLAVSGASNDPGPIDVSLLVVESGATGVPFGSFDTPANGTAGVAGSIAVSGWALDDIGVTTVRILRDPVAGEPPGQRIFIGNATIVDGARPDVAAAFPTSPRGTAAGWGYLLLTNFLPNLGNGTLTLYAVADDVEGHSVILGSKTIACDNAHATAPFGAIDTPGQGDVVSGVVANFGWVLSPASRRSDPPGGGTVTVFVDGAPVGSPSAWNSRSDLSSLFPVSQYSGVNTALGLYGLDTTTLTNGVHTISWSVSDNLGATSGVGSRFFTVSNGSSLVASDVGRVFRPAAVAAVAGSKDPAYYGDVLLGRRGFNLNEPLDYFFPDGDGVVTIEVRELDRIELQLEPGATGALITPQGPRPLPSGAQVDPSTGVFTWAPGAGFVGAYSFRLGSHAVRIVLRPGGMSLR